MAAFLLLAIAVGAALLYVYLTWHFHFWKLRGVPYVQPVPIFGTMKDALLFRRSEGSVMNEMYNRFPESKFVGGFRARKPFLLVRDPDLIRAILVKDFEAFQGRGQPVDERRMPLSVHLFNLEGRRWRALRAKMTPMFTSGKMRLMYRLMDECAEGLTDLLEQSARDGQPVEMREAFSQYATDVIGSCAMGLQFNALKDPDCEFRRVGRDFWAPTLANRLRRLTIVLVPALARLLRCTMEGRRTTDFILRAVREMVEYREKHGVERDDFIQLLLQLKKHGKVAEDKVKDDDRVAANAVKSSDEIQMTGNLMAAQVWVFFIAGFETSSTASSFVLYELALHPDIQERLRDEVDAVLRDNGNRVPYEALTSMQYLDKVWNEGLRKYSPANFIRRRVTRVYTLPNTDVTLPVGTTVDIPVWALHHDPQYFPEPERFDPERFSEEAKATRHHYSFLPFGEGPRICIGRRFGVQEGKLGIAKILSKFRLSPCERTRVPIRFDPRFIVTASADGVWLKVEPR